MKEILDIYLGGFVIAAFLQGLCQSSVETPTLRDLIYALCWPAVLAAIAVLSFYWSVNMAAQYTRQSFVGWFRDDVKDQKESDDE